MPSAWPPSSSPSLPPPPPQGEGRGEGALPQNSTPLSRRTLLLGLGALAALTLPGCDEAPQNKPLVHPQSQPVEPIKIGAFLSISGPQSEQARQLLIGFNLAIDEANNNQNGINGRPIQLVLCDTRGKQDLAGSGVVRLITSDKVVALLGECNSSLSIAGGHVAQEYKTPMVSPTSTNPQVSKIGDMVYTVAFVDTFQGAVGARFAVEELKAKTAAILYDQKQTYCVGLRDAFKKAFTDLGGKIVVEQTYTTGEAEFGPQLINIKNARPDILYISAYSQDAAIVARLMKAQGLAIPTLGGDGLDSPDFGAASQGAAEGWYATSFFADGDQTPAALAFAADFKAKTGQDPCAASVQALDAARVLIDAIRRADSTSGPDIAKQIAATRNFPSPTGAFSIGPGRTVDKPALVMRLTGGKWRRHTQYASTQPAATQGTQP